MTPQLIAALSAWRAVLILHKCGQSVTYSLTIQGLGEIQIDAIKSDAARPSDWTTGLSWRCNMLCLRLMNSVDAWRSLIRRRGDAQERRFLSLKIHARICHRFDRVRRRQRNEGVA